MRRFAEFIFLTLATTCTSIGIEDAYRSAADSLTSEQTDASTPYDLPESYQIPGDVIVDIGSNITSADIDALSRTTGYNFSLSSEHSADNGLIMASVDNVAEAVDLLKRLPQVQAVEPVQFYMTTGSVLSVSNDPKRELQWHLTELGADVAYRANSRGQGVLVAVVDTGLYPVSDLDPSRYIQGQSFVPGETLDGNGHGTHVAGTIGQWTDNGVLGAGVAPDVQILGVKVLSDNGSGRSDWIADGIDWAVDQGAKVINLSLGGGYSEVIDIAVQEATAAGVVVVAACGNSDVPRCDFPGGLKDSIGVSAYGPSGKRASYSSYGVGVDIAAPGGDKKTKGGGVWQQTYYRGEEVFAEFQGTSMATPHVAGAVAVLLGTGLTGPEAVSALKSTAKETDNTLEWGAGKVDLEAALSSSSESTGIPYRYILYAALMLLPLCYLKTGWLFKAKVAATAVTLLLLVSNLPSVLLLLPVPQAVNGVLWYAIMGAFWIPLVPLLFAFLTGWSKMFRPVAAGWLLTTAVLHIAVLNFALILGPSLLNLICAFVAYFFTVGLFGVENLEQQENKS